MKCNHTYSDWGPVLGVSLKAVPWDLCVIKMLIDSLIASHLVYALHVWGPSLSVGLLHRITRLHNHGVRMIFGLRKYDHVSQHRFTLGWLPVDLVTRHHSLIAMYKQYKSNHCCC